MKRIMQYYAEYAVVLYSLGMRAAFYTVLIRFSSSREQWYPDKLVHCCCTQARNALGLLSLLSEVVDASLALQCGSGLYLARRAIGDSVTLARYAADQRVRTYGLAILAGASIWSVVNCKLYGAGAILQCLVNLLIEIKMKKPNSRYVRHWGEA